MDSIGLSPQIKLPSLPAQSAPSAPAIALPDPSAGLPKPAQDQVDFNAQAAEQNRAAAVHKAAQQVANVFVIGDQTFSLFKDATGQYITRFTSLRDGKVTYIPEPTLFKLSGSSSGNDRPLLKIQA
jgi:hypothetical protein